MSVIEKARELGWPVLESADIDVDPDASRLMPMRLDAVAVARTADSVEVVLCEVPTVAMLRALERTCGSTVTVTVTSRDVLEQLRTKVQRDAARSVATLLSAPEVADPAVVDVTLRLGHPPLLRTRTGVVPLDGWAAFTHEELTAALAFCGLTFTPDGSSRYPDVDEAVFTWSQSTWRATATGSLGAPLVRLSRTARTDVSLTTLRLPAQTSELAAAASGLVVVSSRPRNGRSTTLAALINQTATATHRQVTHLTDGQGLLFAAPNVISRRIGPGGDAACTSDAVRRALADGTEVLAVDHAVLDADTVAAALGAAAAGLLVLLCVPASSLTAALSTLIETPGGDHDALAGLLATSFVGGLHQTLIATNIATNTATNTGAVSAAAAGTPVGPAVPAADLWWTSPAAVHALRFRRFATLAQDVSSAGTLPACHADAAVLGYLDAGLVSPAAVHAAGLTVPTAAHVAAGALADDVPTDWPQGPTVTGPSTPAAPAPSATSATSAPSARGSGSASAPAGRGGKRVKKAGAAAEAARRVLSDDYSF